MKQELNGVVVFGFGSQPLDFISKGAKLCGKGSVLNQDVARMAGANFAFGQPECFAELHRRLEIGAFTVQCQETPGLSVAATNWLATGSRGLSSNTMFTVLTGVDALGGSRKSYPHDPDDLDRCLRLLHAVPELRQLLQKMSEVSPEWAALIVNWEEIERLHIDEVGLGWTKAKSAPRTYELMRKVIDSCDTKENNK